MLIFDFLLIQKYSIFDFNFLLHRYTSDANLEYGSINKSRSTSQSANSATADDSCGPSSISANLKICARQSRVPLKSIFESLFDGTTTMDCSNKMIAINAIMFN